MRRWPAIAVLLIGLAGIAVAQDRPPDAPDRHNADQPDDARPPQRPDIAAPAEKPEVSADDQPDDKSQKPQMFGPPRPPAWAVLRENDQDYAACRLALSLLGTAYEEIAPVTDPDDPDCGIARPIRVTEILPGLILDGGADMRCDTARALGFWARDFLRPAAAALPGAPRLTGLRLGSTYACRARVGTAAKRPKISEHALGNAIDISGFLFEGADPLSVAPREDTGDQAEAFQRSARATACLFFTTVLGPGANAAHASHLHLDVIARGNGWRLCQ